MDLPSLFCTHHVVALAQDKRMQEHRRNPSNSPVTFDARMFRYGFIASLIGGAIGLMLAWITQLPRPDIVMAIGASLAGGIGVKYAILAVKK
jgi:uncharacterized membrane protein YccC